MGMTLVTGGAGFLGVNLLRSLMQRGEAISSLDLEHLAAPDLGSHVRHHRGDIRRKDDLITAMRGARAVVHCAAALPRAPLEEIRSTDVEGTRLVLEVAQELGVERVVFISSTAVYALPWRQPVDESAPLEGLGPYGEAKVEAEAACVQARRSGLIVPVLRPRTFVGPERLGVFSLLYAWAAEGRSFPILGAGTNLNQLLDVEDLCEVIVRALTYPSSAVNDVFNVGAGEFGTFREDLQAVLDAAGFGRTVRSLPAGPAVRVLRLLERLHLSPLYPWIYETALKDSYVSTEKVARVLGFTPRFSNRQALLRNYAWYLKNAHRLVAGTATTHRTVWRPGMLALARYVF